MNFNEYQLDAKRTMVAKTDIINVDLGLAGEAGEFADSIKKHVYHDHPLNRAHLIKELGDILWYVAVGAEILGIRLESVAVENIAKLRERYPEGFDPARSQNRSI